MSVHYVDAGEVAALRERAVAARAMPASRAQRWEKSPVDPMDVVRVFAPGVRVRDGWVIRAYRISGGLGGGGLALAMPASAAFPEPSTCFVKIGPNEAERPVPEGAVPIWAPAFHDAFVLDGTPRAFLSYSLLVRELGELGAEWHAISWGNRRLLVHDPTDGVEAARVPEAQRFTIDAPPGGPPPMRFESVTVERDGQPVIVPQLVPPKGGWALAMNATWPEDWRPEVRVFEDGAVEVALLLHSAHLTNRIWRQIDRYPSGSLRFSTREVGIAFGGAGFVY